MPRKGLSGNVTKQVNQLLNVTAVVSFVPRKCTFASNAVLNGPPVSRVQTRPTKPASRQMKSRQGQWSDLVHARSRMAPIQGIQRRAAAIMILSAYSQTAG